MDSISNSATPPPGQSTFGRLEPLKIRDYWKDEARDFTPWLAKEDNLSLLGETIGLNLELVGTEQRVGPFKADILARDGEFLVIVENQLDATDHKHLGQLMVYAAGRKAHTVVWIAKQVTDEYREVIDWLNRETTVHFWALEMELWQIGGSDPAPKFNVVCEPNELTKQPDGEPADLSGTKLMQLDFWKGFAEHLESGGSSFNSRKAFPQNWYDLSIGTSRAHISATALVGKNGRLGCELYIGHSQADVIFEGLSHQEEAIEGEIGETLEWQPLPEKKSCRIALYRQADFEDREKWPDLYAWLSGNAEKFKVAFAERVKQVDLPTDEGSQPMIQSEIAAELSAVPAAGSPNLAEPNKSSFSPSE